MFVFEGRVEGKSMTYKRLSYMVVDFYGGELIKIPSCHDMSIYRNKSQERRDQRFFLFLILYFAIRRRD